MNPIRWKDYLDIAQCYAEAASGCAKVAVGSVIAQDGRIVSAGANRGVPNLCKTARGCFRMEKYGDDSKSHRNPEDCRAIHSEVDAICSAALNGITTKGATIFITRYPCEGCAKAIISAGIKTIVYGGTAKASPVTYDMFDRYGVECVHVLDWKEDNSDR